MRDVYVIGIGMTKFDRYPGVPGSRLGAQALRAAIDDAAIAWPDVELLIGAHVDSGLNATLELLHEFQWTGIPAFTVSSASATGSQAVAQAFQAVATGQANVVAAVGFERMLSGSFASNLIEQAGVSLNSVSGFTPLSTFGMLKDRRMHDYGEPDEVFAEVVSKNFGNAAKNPFAQRQREVSVADVLASPMVADPLHKLELCPVGDGAAAVIVASREALGDTAGRAIKIMASVQLTDPYHDLGPFGVDLASTKVVAARAYEQAGVGPEDLDVVEVHDAASVEELFYYEYLGLCAEGEGGRFVADGSASIGGRVAVSPSGGLLARGHPGGGTGTAQIFEIVQQLRKEAGPRQQPDARIGLAHMLGGIGLWIVHILGR